MILPIDQLVCEQVLLACMCVTKYVLLLTVLFAPLVSRELTGDSITDLIQQNWIGALVTMIVGISTCALLCYFRGRRGSGQGRQGGKWMGGRGRKN